MKKVLSFILIFFLECTMLFNSMANPISAEEVSSSKKDVDPFLNLHQMLEKWDEPSTVTQVVNEEKSYEQTETKDKAAEEIPAYVETNENEEQIKEDVKDKELLKNDNKVSNEEINTALLPLSTPTNLRTIESSNFIVITWDSIESAEKYELEIDGRIIDCGNKTMYVQSDLKDMNIHKYRVRAVSSNTTSQWSEYIEGCLKEGDFDSSCNVISSASSNYMIVCWSTVINATGYEIEVDGKVINNGMSTNYIHQGLTPNTTHSYRVRAIKGDKYTKWSKCITDTTLNVVIKSETNDNVDKTKKTCDEKIENNKEQSIEKDKKDEVKTNDNKTVKTENKTEDKNNIVIVEEMKNKLAKAYSKLEAEDYEKKSKNIEAITSSIKTNTSTKTNSTYNVDSSEIEYDAEGFFKGKGGASVDRWEKLGRNVIIDGDGTGMVKLKISPIKKPDASTVLKYQVYVYDKNTDTGAWQDVKSEGQEAGVIGKEITSVKIWLEGNNKYDVRYNSITDMNSKEPGISGYVYNGKETLDPKVNKKPIYDFVFEIVEALPKVDISTCDKTTNKWSSTEDTNGFTGGSNPISKIKLTTNRALEGFKLKYQVFIKENCAWQDWKYDSEIAGEDGKTITNIRAKVEDANGYSIRYKFKTIDDNGKVLISQYGKNGYEPVNSNNNFNNITGVFFEILKGAPKLEVYTYFDVPDRGKMWMCGVDTDVYGPDLYPIKKLKIFLKDAPSDANIKYQVYLKNKKVWQDWKSNGDTAGLDDDFITNIRIKLDGETLGSSIKYNFNSSENFINYYISNDGYNGVEPKGSLSNTAEICKLGIYLCNYQPISNLDISKDIIVLDGKYEIPEGTEFTIPSGKKIILDYSKTKNVGFSVNGTLNLNGTASNPIKIVDEGKYSLFTIGKNGKLIGSYVNVTSSRENGKEELIKNLGELNISYSSFTNTKKGTYFLNSKSSKDVKIDSCTIDSWGNGVIVDGTGNFSIKKSNIKNNIIGIVIQDGEGYSIKNKIEIADNPNIYNNEVGIFVNRIGQEALHKKLEIISNTFDNSISSSLELYSDNLSNIVFERNTIKNNNKDGKYNIRMLGGESSIGASPISINLSMLKDATIGTSNFINSLNKVDENKGNILDKGNNINAIVLYEKLSTSIQLEKGKYQYALVNVTIGKGGSLLIDKGTKLVFDGVINVEEGQLLFNGDASENIQVNCVSTSKIINNSSQVDYSKSRYKVTVGKNAILNATYTVFFRGGISSTDLEKDASLYIEGSLSMNNCIVDNDINNHIDGIVAKDNAQVNLTNVTVKNCLNGIEGNCGILIGCIFKNNNCGINVLYGECKISKCTIKNNKNAGIWAEVNTSIYHSTIQGNKNNINIVPNDSNKQFVLYNNTICDGIYGIQIIQACKVEIKANNIYNHQRFGLDYTEKAPINAQYNYWGSSNGPSCYVYYSDFNKKRQRTYIKGGDKVNNILENIDLSSYSIKFITNMDLGINEEQIINDSYKVLSDYAINLKKALYKNGVDAPTGNYSKLYNDLLVKTKGIDINLSRIYSSRKSTAETLIPIRTGTSDTANKIGTLKKDDVVEVLEIIGDWCKIKFNNLEGYVKCSCLDITETVITVDVTGITKLSGTSSKLNVRSQNNTSSRIIGTLSYAQTFPILAVIGNWFKIRYGSQEGYISRDYAAFCDSNSLKASGTIHVKSSYGYLNVRSAPNTSSSILGRLNGGNVVNITAKNGNWYTIDYNGSSAYVSTDYVTINSVDTTRIKKSGKVKADVSNTMLGKGWTFYYESFIEGINTVSPSINTEGKVVTLPGGDVYTFKKNSDGTYSPIDNRCTLTTINGEFILKNKENITYYFNSSYQLYKISDNKNNAIYFAYDGKLLTKIYDECGRVYNFTYNGDLLNKITEVIDGKTKRTIKYNFNSNNMLEYVIDVNGNIQEKFKYDSNNRLSSITQGDNELEKITYFTDGDDKGKIDTISTITGLVNKYSYDNANNLVTITDNLGNVEQKMYDSTLSVVYTIDQDGYSTVNKYVIDSKNNMSIKELSSEKDKNGCVTSYVRDEKGNIIKTIYDDNSSIEYEYDNYNNVIKKIDKSGNKTFYKYDSQGVYLLKVITPLNGRDEFTTDSDLKKFAITSFEYYDKSNALPIAGLVKKITKASGGCVEYTYDKFGNTLSETDLAGNITKYSYDKFGNKVQTIDPNGFSTINTYDNKGKVLTSSNSLNQTIQYFYDKYDRKIAQIDPNNSDSISFNITYTYDEAGRVISKTDSLSNKVEYTYDEYGNRISEKNSVGGTFLYDYDRSGRVTRVSFKESNDDEAVILQEFTYELPTCELDIEKSSKGFRVIKTTKTYTGKDKYYTTVDKFNYLNVVVEHINADNSTEFTSYDGNGNIICSIDENGTPTYYYYDYNNNLIKSYEAVKVDSNGNFKYRETKYTYNLDGIKTSVSVGLELVDKDCEAKSFYTTTYSVDRRGLVSEEIDSEGRKTEYAYDKKGNVISKKQYLTKDTYITNEYEYNIGSKLIAESIIVQNGDIAGNNITDTRTSKLTTRYTYDKNGNLLKKEFADGSTLETEYDALNRAVKNTRTVIGKNGVKKTIKETISYLGNTDKVSKITDGEGHVTVNTYNKKLELIKTDYDDGTTINFYYSIDGKEIKKTIKDAASKNTREFVKEYDSSGNVILEQYAAKDANGKVIYYPIKAYQYDSQGNLIKEIYGNAFMKAAGKTTEDKIKNAYGIEYSYNLENKISTVLNIKDKLDGKKYSTAYEYDTLGRKIKETDSKGNSILYTLDFAGNILKKNFVGNVNGNNNMKILLEENTYDLCNNLTSSKDANNNTTEYVINSFGVVKIKKLPGDTTIDKETYTYQYDKMGNTSVITDSTGLTTKTIYNSLGKVVSKTLQGKNLNEVINEEYEYDALGNVTSYKDANGNTITYKYDIYGNVIEKSINGQVVFRYSYDFFKNLLYTVDRFGNKVTHVYDDGERLVETIDAYNKVIEKYQYDLNGNKISKTDALGNITKYEYDVNDRVIKSTDPEGIITSKSYDSLGQVISETDGNGNITYYNYDGLGKLISVKNSLNEVTVYTYDLNGNKISVTDAKGNITKYKYNAGNKVSEIIAPNTGNLEKKVQKYTYNADGSIKNVKDRNGNLISYEYDIFGRKIKESNGSNVSTFVYDKLGNLLKVTNTADPTGNITYSYDSESRITEKTVAAKTPVTIKYEYDKKAGNPGEHYNIITDSKGGKIVETYDKMGRLISVNDGKDETKYTYLADGTKSSTIFSDNSRETYSYNKNSQLVTLTHIDAAGKTTAVYSYKYDKNKNVISKVDNKGTTSYVYDSLNRLVKVTEPDKTITVYKYDKAGNRANESVTKDGKTLEKAYYYDIENRLIKTIDCLTGVKLETNYTFDANGNQTAEITKDFSSGKVLKNREIIYDQYNRVIEIRENGKVLEKNTYNYEGLRVTKETDNKKVLYIYDGKNVLLELDSLGNVLARNVFGTKLISREITGNLKGFYRYNGHGDVVKIVDKSGKVLVEYYYDAFGTIKESAGSFDNPYRYSGYIYDEEAKYYYLQSRMYDPLLGRFIQEDSYRGDEKDPLSLNLYTYCLNNPMIYDDQNGHWPSFLSKIGSAVSNAWNGVKSFVSNAWNGVKSFVSNAWNGVKSFVSNVWNGAKSVVKNVVSWGKQKYNNAKAAISYISKKASQNKYVKATISAAQRAYNYTKAQMNKAIQAVKKVDVSKLAVGALNLIQGGAAIGLGAGLTAVCPPAGIGLIALGTGTALIGFGQAAEATGHEDPIRNFANNLGISNKAYDTASEAIPLLTSLGCMGATSVLQFSALRSGATSAADTVANMSEHATEAEKRVISYETDASSMYVEGNASKVPTGKKFTLPGDRNPQCFVAGTLIVTELGDKPIEEIKVGDKVYSENEYTGEKGFKKVKRLFVNLAKTLVHLIINGIKIDTTEKHPFWVIGKGWVNAADLKSGNKVSLKTGEIGNVDSVEVETLDEPVKVYNFEVEDWHTYFVSNIGVLVHNKCWVDAEGVSKAESKQLVNGPYIKNGKPNGRPTSSGKKKLQFERDVYNDNVDLDGILRDPNTGEVIDWKPGQPRRGIVDFGHKSGYSYKEMFNKYKNGEITLDELKDFQTNPDNYRLETPSANRSHKFE